MELYPGTKVTIGPPIETGFYYDFEFPAETRSPKTTCRRSSRRCAKHIERRRGVRPPRRPGRRGDRDLQGPGPGLQGRADRRPGPRRRGRDRLALPQRRLRGPLPRPARALDRADQGDQAQLGRRRLLARRREPREPDPDLRHRLLLQEGPRAAPGADRGGEGARPPPPRPPARPLHAARRGAGDAVLAAQRDDAAAPDRGRGPGAAAQARLPGDRHAAGARRGALAPLRALGQLPRRDVLHGGRRAPLRAAADELPRRLPRLLLRPPLLPRAAAAPGRVRPRLPQRARGRAARPAARPRLHPGRRPRLLHRGPDHRRGGEHLRGDRRALRPLRLRATSKSSSRPGRRSRSAPRSSGRRPRRR